MGSSLSVLPIAFCHDLDSTHAVEEAAAFLQNGAALSKGVPKLDQCP